MANATNLYGLKPVRMRNGSKYDGQYNLYHIPASYGSNVFIGDLVKKTEASNTAVVRTSSSDYAIGTLPECVLATIGTTNKITGVVIGFECMSIARVGELYGPLSTERVAMVADDPNVVFQIRDDGAAALATTVVSLNAEVIQAAAGSTATGLSGLALDSNSAVPATTAGFQLQILRGARSDNNAIGSASAEWEVVINTHTEALGTGQQAV